MERYNPWWINEEDIGYTQWKEAEINWIPKIVNDISLESYSLNFIFGPRQVGKTTSIKILIHRLLESHDPKAIFYYSCDELTDHHELGEIIDNYLSARKAWGIKKSFIFLDEITFVNEWWRAIKSRVDSGELSGDVLTVTGSASMELMKQREFFPGRRGKGGDYLMMPLSFSEYTSVLSNIELSVGKIEEIEKNVDANRLYSSTLKELFMNYLKTGGFPRAIRDFYRYGKVSPETMKIYLDWIRGDWAKAGKSEKYMKEVLAYIITASGTPISWNGIASETSINSPHTARSYIEVLEGMFTVTILHMLSPQSKILYRKNRKIHFTDPLLYRVFSNYTGVKFSEDWLVEGVSASLIGRKCPVFYWRNSTEVDVVCKLNGEQISFEITRGLKKWKKPWHIRKAYLLDKENIHLYLASI